MVELGEELKDCETQFAVVMIQDVCNVLDFSVQIIEERMEQMYQTIRSKIGNNTLFDYSNLLAISFYLAVKESRGNPTFTIKEIAEAFQKSGHPVTIKSILKTVLLMKFF
ncbi:MAG: hypothetical protein ACFFD2_00580 [Promethearchaeota archaeon]